MHLSHWQVSTPRLFGLFPGAAVESRQSSEQPTMTNTIVTALGQSSRRSFVAGLAAMLPIATASAATAALPSADIEMVKLAAEIAVLREHEKIALAECTRCNKIFEQNLPEKSRGLLWRIHDPVKPWDYEPIVLANGSRYLWTNPHEIERMAERGAVGDKRSAELVRLHNEWKAARKAGLDGSGYTAAEESLDQIVTQLAERFDKMLQLRPSTIEGYKALATGILFCCWAGKIDIGGSADSEGLALLMSSLTGVPIADDA